MKQRLFRVPDLLRRVPALSLIVAATALFSPVAQTQPASAPDDEHGQPADGGSDYYERHMGYPPQPSSEVPRPGELAFRRKVRPQELSRGNREGKTLSLLVDAGLTPWPSVGGAVGLFLSPQVLLEVSGAVSKFHDPFLSSSGIRRRIDAKERWSTQLYTGQAKVFWGNSLYVNLGVGVRYIANEVAVSNIGYEDETSYATTELNMGGLLAVGHRWQWRHITAGCDWIGLYFPLGYLTRTFEPWGLTESVAAERKRKYMRRYPDFAPQLPRCQAGISF